MKQLPVRAVIPAYNADETISILLDELIKQRYDDIYVIDDASTDDTIKIIKKYGAKVKLIENNENVGSGANRNRIIGKTSPSIIHFTDADMKLLSQNTPDIIRKLKWPKHAAFIAGMVRNPDGTQNPFNFGQRPHVFQGKIQGALQFTVWLIGRIFRTGGVIMRKLFSPLLRGMPTIYTTPYPSRVYWAAESNMVVRSEEFARHGGYDPQFRYSEITDFALRIHQKGYHGYFYPSIDAMHSSWDNIFKSRDKRHEANKKFAEKHGRLAYFLPFLASYLAGRKTQKRYQR